MPRHRAPRPGATCVNVVMDQEEQWAHCGRPWDQMHPDAAPFCPRCREAANAIGAGLALWISEQYAAMNAAHVEAADAA